MYKLISWYIHICFPASSVSQLFTSVISINTLDSEVAWTRVKTSVIRSKRINHQCDGGIEKICPEGHRLASQGLPSDDNL